MKPMKPLGQIAMEAARFPNDDSPCIPPPWDALDQQDQDYWEGIATAVRNEVQQRCADIALAHKGQAPAARRKTWKDEYIMSEIRAEERGEDIAAEEIAKKILEDVR
jgi:hypothetical protein